ncbi:MAG: metallophosphoesterase [Saccharofermentanales bacterium]
MIIFTAMLGLALLARGLYEPRTLAVSREAITANHKRGNKKQLVRIALISDLHADKLWIKPEQVSLELERHPVDLVLFAGDVAGTDQKADEGAHFLKHLAAKLRETGTPFLAVPGNHDGPRAITTMRAAGLHVLLNEQRHFDLPDGTKVLISGLANQRSKRKSVVDLSAANRLIEKIQLEPGAAGIHIVLVHNPDTALDLPENGADFLLGGHFHGGQIYAPFRLEFRLLRRDRLPKLGYSRGSFNIRGYRGYITRGLGCVWLPFRFLSLPELALLELIVEPEADT